MVGARLGSDWWGVGHNPPRALWGSPRKHDTPAAGTGIPFDCWVGSEASVVLRRVLKIDHWFYGLFKSHPDLITLLLPSVGAAGASAVPSLGPDAPGDVLYRFDATELNAVNHRLDGVFWPEAGNPACPIDPWCCWRCRCRAWRGSGTGSLPKRHSSLPGVNYIPRSCIWPWSW